MSVLQEIIDYKKKIVRKNKLILSAAKLQDLVKNQNYICKKVDFLPSKKLNLIAEIKRKSPSKGIIRVDFDPQKIALEFQKSQAAILSVLTDEKYFGGSMNIFEEVRKISSLPLLRKDFILDTYQVWETKYLQADIILLLANVLEDKLEEFLDLSLNLGLNCLIEIHTRDELKKILKILEQKPKEIFSKVLVGINNRNLNTFEVNLKNCLDLKNLIPKEIKIVAESGINQLSDLQKLELAKFDAVLIGEGLVTNPELLSFFSKST